MPAFYTNVTPPTILTWDTASYPYYLLSFIYDERTNDWHRVRLTYSSAPFEYVNGAITNPAEAYFSEYSDGSWDNFIATIDAGEMAYPIGKNGGVYQRYWTSHDITGLMAAGGITKGAWLYNEKDFWTGVAMGLKSKGLPAKQDKQPIAYLYNGVQLPGLPEEWNSDERPYAVIYADTRTNKECLFVSKVPLILYDLNGDGNYTFSASGDGWGGSLPIKFENEGAKWVEGFLFPQHIEASTYIWSNYDIQDLKGLVGAAGSVYREGSEPIPVYE